MARQTLGVVVGRGKETKIRIERESGARVEMVPPTGRDEWTCRITGGHEETAMAARIVQDLIDTSEVCAELVCYEIPRGSPQLGRQVK